MCAGGCRAVRQRLAPIIQDLLRRLEGGEEEGGGKGAALLYVMILYTIR